MGQIPAGTQQLVNRMRAQEMEVFENEGKCKKSAL
jgi:hypothetical protein